ncbi:lipoprotein [Pseudomonas fluorescens]|uniref:Lipoprotein n=1 Tax=Pseudomonas fluorescens TaxID=294 RepID=A0A3S4SUQ9_PSEFL|nr:lipoprotein [Pseudomonas fluorescens]
MSAVWRLFVVSLVLLLSACASQSPLPAGNPTLPLPLQLHIERLQADQRQDWLLVIQREGPGIRWSMMDPLGIPQARQQLIDGHWQADGLLPPNPEARELFAALLFALTPSGELLRNYPTAQQQAGQRALPARWDVRYAQPLSFELNLPQGPQYRVSQLGESTP